MLRINRCLNPKLSELCQKVLYLEELNDKIAQFLPDNLRRLVKACSFTHGKLVLIVSGQEWASQLRYSLPELRDKLRCEGKIYNLTTIKIKLDAPDRPGFHIASSLPKKNGVTMPTEAKRILKEAGEQCHYKPLQDALMRLAGVEKK